MVGLSDTKTSCLAFETFFLLSRVLACKRDGDQVELIDLLGPHLTLKIPAASLFGSGQGPQINQMRFQCRSRPGGLDFKHCASHLASSVASLVELDMLVRFDDADLATASISLRKRGPETPVEEAEEQEVDEQQAQVAGRQNISQHCLRS